MSNKAMWRRLEFLPAFAVLFAVECSDIVSICSGGGGSETINARIIITDTVAIVEADARQKEFLTMRIFTGQYKPFERMGFSDSVSREAASALEWSAPFSGEFNFILSLGMEAGMEKAAFIPAVGLMPGVKDTIRCGLKKCTTFKGRIAATDPASAYVLFIQGSPFFCVSDSMLHFSIPGLPSGRYTLKTRPVKGRLFMKTNSYYVDTDSLGENVDITIEEP